MNLIEPKWNGDNAVALRDFLESEHGQKFIARMTHFRPSFSPQYDSTRRLVESGIAEGYELFFTVMASLMVPTPEKPEDPVENYPDLDGPGTLFNE